jgi:hypothetical protein
MGKKFVKYQHVERFGTEEVENIELGVCHVFPKIDGTNGSVWLDDGEIKTGSRNRELSIEADNAGFDAAIIADERVKTYLEKHPDHRLYGEWLVPHSLKTYRDDAWRKFYIFDVCVDSADGAEMEYLPYSVYKPMLEEFSLDYIPLMAEARNASFEQFIDMLEKNTFLVKDGLGAGEGIVIKNYSYKNKYGRTTWAKIVRSEFKEIHSKTMGAAIVQGDKMVEEEIVARFCTTALIEKEFAKIANESGGWSSRYIPRLLQSVFYSLVSEESWNIVKEYKLPKINYKTLNALVIGKIKTEKKEIFA